MPFFSGEHFPAGQPVSKPNRWSRIWINLGRRFPVMVLFAIFALSNITGSLFNIAYNIIFIVDRLMDADQQQVFFNLAVPVYNLIAYPVGLSIALLVLRPIARHHKKILRGESLSEADLQTCRKVLINVPFYQFCVNSMCWLPGAVFIPAMISFLASPCSREIWLQFAVSFFVAAGLTVVQTFFFMEEFLVRVLYPIYFQDTSPVELRGTLNISFFWRLTMLWAAVALMPLFAILVIAENVEDVGVRTAFVLTVVGGLVSGGAISYFVYRGLLRWIRDHQMVTDELAQRNFQARVREKRPDEWGRLTDRFNEMAAELGQAEHMRETFGQIVHPGVRDAIMERFPELTVEDREITVMFVDIRGFTKRTTGMKPEKVGQLLRRFLAATISAVETDKDKGLANKFLGDGIMALFGAHTPEPISDHADVALEAALELLNHLALLNTELVRQGENPLQIGIGINSGQALVGCFGAYTRSESGKMQLRREFTAVGETINLGQRLEQLTKTLGGPILLSESTRRLLCRSVSLFDHGDQSVHGYTKAIQVHRVLEESIRPPQGSSAKTA